MISPASTTPYAPIRQLVDLLSHARELTAEAVRV
jgi:hypothetical protein